MAGEYDKQFEQLTQLIEGSAKRTEARFEEITQIVSRTSGRLDELTLEVRDLRKTLIATNEKIDVLHSEVTGNLVRESKRISTLEGRVDILEQKPH